MIWLWMLLLALLTLAPLALVLRRPATLRGRREADLALYRAQLVELDAELAAGRLDAPGLAAARLEVQRRLLATPELAGPQVAGKASPRVLAALLAVPLVALVLYVFIGTPDMPSAPYAERHAIQARDEALMAQLRTRLEQLGPNSEQARPGWVLIGDAERRRGGLAAAAEAYRRALAGRFNADITAQLAQVLLEDDKADEAATLLAAAVPQAPQHIGLRFLAGSAAMRAGRTEDAKTIWRALLADAPAEAPWRPMVQRQLEQLP